MRYDLYQKEREKAKVAKNGLKILCETSVNGKPTLMIWRPKASKPYVHYYFRSIKERADYIKAKIDAYNEYIVSKNVYKEKRKAETEKLISEVKVGDILYDSWGYDQTNVDFYQVTKVTGRMIKVREICAKSVEGSQGFMSDNVVAVKDAFREESKEQLVTVNKYWKYDGSPHYRSWYA